MVDETGNAHFRGFPLTESVFLRVFSAFFATFAVCLIFSLPFFH
jgi:hypothetical protein